MKHKMNNLAITYVSSDISTDLVTLACKTMGTGDASMIIGGSVGGAVGALHGSKTKQSDKEDHTQLCYHLWT